MCIGVSTVAFLLEIGLKYLCWFVMLLLITASDLSGIGENISPCLFDNFRHIYEKLLQDFV